MVLVAKRLVEILQSKSVRSSSALVKALSFPHRANPYSPLSNDPRPDDLKKSLALDMHTSGVVPFQGSELLFDSAAIPAALISSPKVKPGPDRPVPSGQPP